MFFGEFLDLTDDMSDGHTLMVPGKNQHLHRAAVAVEKSGAGVDRGDRLRQHIAVARQCAPLQIAFVPTGIDHLGQTGQRHHRLHAVHVAHMQLEAIDGIHDFKGGAGAFHPLRLGDH